jgi:hypothetical protein
MSTLILSFHLRIYPPTRLFFSGLLTKMLYLFLIPLILAKSHVYLILLNLITLIIFGEELKLLKSITFFKPFVIWYVFNNV